MQGMSILGSKLIDPFINSLPGDTGDIPSMKRLPVSDSFVMSLLRGARMCM